MKIRKILFSSILLFVVISLIIIAGCMDQPLMKGSKGTLVLNLDSQVSKTIIPDTDMVIDSYLIEGSGPGGATFTPVIVDGGTTSVVIPDIIAGTWTIEVTARNADDPPTNIGSGVKIVSIVVDGTVTLTIPVGPLDGTGNLSLTCSWMYPIRLIM